MVICQISVMVICHIISDICYGYMSDICYGYITLNTRLFLNKVTHQVHSVFDTVTHNILLISIVSFETIVTSSALGLFLKKMV